MNTRPAYEKVESKIVHWSAMYFFLYLRQETVPEVLKQYRRKYSGTLDNLEF